MDNQKINEELQNQVDNNKIHVTSPDDPIPESLYHSFRFESCSPWIDFSQYPPDIDFLDMDWSEIKIGMKFKWKW